MLKRYITIDGGTTNTRLFLIENGKCIDIVKLNVGVGANMRKPGALQAEIKGAIELILQRNSLNSCDIIRILASGMLTSEFGLYNLPHISAPSGIDELHAALSEVKLLKVSDIPFVFIPGVKTTGNIESSDIMRGEETELMGLLKFSRENSVFVLPGSHSKIIKTDSLGRISEFTTMLTGEMIAALAENTVLKSAVDLSIDFFNEEYLIKGCDFALTSGLNNALFKVRILKNVFSASYVACYSFFLGAVLSDEIRHIIKLNPKSAVIAGKRQIKNATALLLQKLSNIEVIRVDDEAVDSCVYNGAIRIYEYE